MNRRGFLKSFAVGIAAMSAASSMPGIAANILQPLPGPYSKFKIALDIFDNDILPYACYKNSLPFPTAEAAGLAISAATSGFDKVFVHIRETFILPTAETNAECRLIVRKVLCGRKDEGTLEYDDIRAALAGKPPEIMEQVWPIGLARMIVRDYNIPISFRQSNEWQWFHDTYGRFILGD